MAAAPQPLGAPRRPAAVRRERVVLPDGASTTIHVAEYALARTDVRVALVKGRPLAAWCAANGHRDAIVGGFFTRPDVRPLGEVRTHGVARRYTPFDAPWGAERTCLHVAGGRPRITGRAALPASPRGDLLQAGPMLVQDGRVVYDRRRDPEGFSANARQFDSDITAERHPRAAIGLSEDRILAVACDGRSRTEAGMTLEEMGEVLAALGARSAMNLDGGGSTTLIAGGRLRNRPRAGVNRPEPGGRGIATAIVFVSRD
jgi:hypothetical protein